MQKDKNFEQIIVDGGSTDGTVEMLEDASPEYDLRWISEPDNGQSDAINKGLKMANGEWIAWLNADDFYYPNVLAKVRECFQENTDVVYGDFCFVDQERQVLYCQYNTLPSKLTERFWTRFAGNHCTFFRSTVLKRIGGVDENLDYTMDADLFWRLLQEDHIAFHHLPRTIAARRLHDAAKTVNQSGEEMGEILDEKRQIYRGYVPETVPEIVLTAGVGLSFKTILMLYEALNPKYQLSIRRMLKGVSADYRRAITSLLGD
jgi:glycosyltransferase involved in cell wall biosynthesis